MARDFDGSTDRIDWTTGFDPADAAMSGAFWVYFATIQSGNRMGVVFHNSGDTSNAHILYFAGNNNTPGAFMRDASSGIMQQLITSEPSAGEIHHYGWSQDGNIANLPLVYVDGVNEAPGGGATNTMTTNFMAGSGVTSVGGLAYSDGSCLDGEIWGVGAWDRVLSAAEFASLADGYSPLCFPSGLRVAPPLVRSQVDPISGAAGTLDGTTVVPQRRELIYPAAPQVGIGTAAPGGATPKGVFGLPLDGPTRRAVYA